MERNGCVATYAAKPVEVEAIHLTPENVEALAHENPKMRELLRGNHLTGLLRGGRVLRIRLGDYLVRDVDGGFWAVCPELFEQAYDRQNARRGK